jgi:DNA topoisomerase-1
LRGLISYPRTSSQKLPFTVGLKKIIEKLSENYAKFTKLITRDRPVEGKKSDPAHPAIYPTGEHSDKLTSQEKQIYELIVKRFISCFASEAKLENKRIVVSIDDKEFSASGNQILERGWLDIYPYKPEEKELPDMNGKVLIKEVITEAKETQPSRRYTQASLISELEKRELGTKATRANVIDTLYKRGYISGSQIQATLLGMAVFLALEKYCPMIIDEQLTRNFEEEMEKIQIEDSREKILLIETKIIDEAKEVLLKIAEQFNKHKKEIGTELLSSSNEQKAQETELNTLFKCIACGKGNLIMIRSRRGKRFAGCNNEDCKKTYALPQFGMIKLSDKKCEKCGTQKLMLIKKSRPPWHFCMNPECWQKKDDGSEKKEEKPKKEKKTRKTSPKKTTSRAKTKTKINKPEENHKEQEDNNSEEQ